MTDNTPVKEVAAKKVKADDLLDSEIVIKYTNEITDLLTSYKEKEEQSNTSVEAMDSEFLAIGNKLIGIEESIHKNNPNKITARTLFAATKRKVAKLIKKDDSNVEKVVKVAKFCSTSEHYKNNKNKLPSSWGTLYLLTGLDKKQLDSLFEDKEINASITRDALSKKISAIKNPNNKTIHKISISVGQEKASDENLNRLKNYLKKNFPSWEVK
jgi:hypothetical protein